MFKARDGSTAIKASILIAVIAILIVLIGVWYVSKNKAGADILSLIVGVTNVPAGKSYSVTGKGTIAIMCDKTIPSNIMLDTTGTNYSITNSSSITNIGRIIVMQPSSTVEYLKPSESKVLSGKVILMFDQDENKCGLTLKGDGVATITVSSGTVSIAGKGFKKVPYSPNVGILQIPPTNIKTTGLLGGMSFGLNLWFENTTEETLNTTLECKKARHTFWGVSSADVLVNGVRRAITPYAKSEIVYYPFHNIYNLQSKTTNNTNYDGSSGITGTSPWAFFYLEDPILKDDICTTTVAKIPNLAGLNTDIQFSSSYYFRDGEKYDYKPIDNLSFKGLTGEMFLWINSPRKNYNGAGLHKQRALKVVIPNNFTNYDVYIGSEINNLTNIGLKGTIENYRYVKIITKEPLDLTVENVDTFRFKTDSKVFKELKYSISGSRE